MGPANSNHFRLSNAVKFTSSGSVKLDAHEINLHNEKVRIIFTGIMYDILFWSSTD